MKHHINLLAALAVAAGCLVAACDDDIDQYKVSGLSETEVALESADNIVITRSNMSKVVLQMTYTADGHELYLTNDTTAGTTLGEGVYTLQVSDNEAFSGTNVKTVTLDDPIKGINDIVYTGNELNILATSFGLESGKASKLYFRIVRGYNTDDTHNVIYSDVLSITVTPLYIDMTRAFVLNKDQDAVTDTLYSPTANGIYEGFIGTYGGWTNFYVRDGLEQVWGNYGVDGNFARVDLTTNSAWNFWTAEPAGCIFLSLNTNSGNQYITYTNLATLSVSGGATVDLTFDAGSVTWQGTVETTAADAKLTLSGTTLTNDNGTGDAQANAKTGTMTFGYSAEGILTKDSGTDAITVAKAGEYRLVVDLSSSTYTYTLTNMADVETYPETVYCVIGDSKVELTTALTAGVASGTYTGTVKNETAGTTITFVDGDGNTVGPQTTLENASKYSISLDLAKNNVTLTEITYEVAKTLGLYYDSSYDYLQATLYSGYDDSGELNGVYSGLFYKGADDWNFYGRDDNGVAFGVNSTWDANSVIQGSTSNFWVTAVQTTYLYSFDTPNSTRSETTITSLSLTGDFNTWNLTANTFTDNADGTWTMTDVELIAEQWGPYIVANGSWDLKLYVAEDGKSLTTTPGSYLVSEAGTYDITINALTNSITVTKK